jgi:hypothetical protein
MLPRNTNNSTTNVHLEGDHQNSTAIIGTGAGWAAGDALIMWDAVQQRVWHARIAKLRLVPPTVALVSAIHYKLVQTNVEALTQLQLWEEWWHGNLEDLIIEGTNQYQREAIWLEGGIHQSHPWRNILFDPSQGGAVTYSSIMLKTDTCATAGGTVFPTTDMCGLNFMTLQGLSSGSRRGGYSQLFQGRMQSVTLIGAGCNGSRTAADVCFSLKNSANNTIINAWTEGFYDTGWRLDNSPWNIFHTLWMGVPSNQASDASPVYGNGIELINNSDYNTFLGKSYAIGAASWNSFGAKLVTIDATSDQNWFYKWGLAITATFATEITDAGSDNGFELVHANNGTVEKVVNKIGGVGLVHSATGLDVASATTMTLGSGNVFHVTGTTTITTLNTCNATNSGRAVTLIFNGIATLTDGSNLKLANSFTSSADDTISLSCDGTNWYETSRSVN